MVMALIDPAHTGSWNAARLWGMTFFGYPFEEYVWAFVTGVSWPVLLVFGVGAGLARTQQTGAIKQAGYSATRRLPLQTTTGMGPAYGVISLPCWHQKPSGQP